MTRNDVAQLVLNTLEAGTVQAETNGSWTIGDVTIVNGVKYNYVTSNQPYATAIDDSRPPTTTAIWSARHRGAGRAAVHGRSEAERQHQRRLHASLPHLGAMTARETALT